MTDVFGEKNNNIQPPNILRDEPELLAKVPDFVQIERVEKDIKLTQRELAFELGQTVIDVAGIIDPTPISDSISAMMSLSKGDYVGAALSTVSIIPYIGDALGKPIKEVHNAQKIAQLERKIEGLLRQLKELAPERLEKAAENAMEAVAKGRATLIEKIGKGHSLLRHGPDLTDNQLVRRLKEGIAPDGSIAAQVPRGSTRFSSHEDWLQIREKVSEQITKRAPFHGGVDLTKPPPSDAKGNPLIKEVKRTIEFDRPIGDGFIGKRETLHEIVAQNGRKLDVYGEVESAEELTRVQVTYKWNGKKWEAKQFFPDATDYDPLTRQYTTKPDIKTKLSPVIEKEASLDLGESDMLAQQAPAEIGSLSEAEGTTEAQQFNDSIAEKIRASRERYPIPQLHNSNTVAASLTNPQSPQEAVKGIEQSNPSFYDTLSRLQNVIDELDKQTLARRPQPSPAQRLYEKTAQSVMQQTGLTPGNDRFEPVLVAKLLAEYGYHQAASIIAAGSPRLNEVNAIFGSTTADRQLAELMRQGEQTLQAMRPEQQQKQQDQMEQG
jgi:hypothetical protein